MAEQTGIEKHERPDYTLLTVARFFAAFWVVLFHLSLFGDRNGISGQGLVSNPVFKLGFLGVTFFYVLSGFILGALYQGKVQVKSFYLKRILRIYPSYFIILAVLACMQLFYSPRTFGYYAPVFLLFNAWIPAASQNLLGPAWSLSCEAFFYLIFPFVNMAILRKSNLLTAFTIALTFLPALIALVLRADAEVLKSSRLVFFPLVHVPSFLIGILFAGFKPAQHRFLLLFGISIAFLVGMNLINPDNTIFMLGTAALPFAVIIWALASQRQPDSKSKSFGALVLLGNASYVLYLSHLPLLQLFQRSGHLRNGREMLFAVCACVAFSVLFYLAIDRPIHFAGLKWIKRILAKKQ